MGTRIVIATRPQVLGVNAQTNAFVATGGVDQRLDLVEAATHGAARSGRILDQDRTVFNPGWRGVRGVECALEGLGHLRQRGFETGALVRADVEYDARRGHAPVSYTHLTLTPIYS